MVSDTIAAVATGSGRAALAVIRLSGPDAFAIARQVIPRFEAVPRRMQFATFRDAAGQPIDRGLVVAFPGPASSSGEDTVEFHCHGGQQVSADLLAALHAAGARAARPGEFTLRAVLHGKLDLVQAEAIGDLVEATAARQRRQALQQLDGNMSRRLAAFRGALIDTLALLSYAVDFPEEDDGPLPRARLHAALTGLQDQMTLLLQTAGIGERIRAGAQVVLAGRPNAGKSSLFNALLGIDRALVTEIPGTTRDTIEAALDLGGWPVRLFDTAGLWEATDRLDQLGVAMSRRYLEAADLLLVCVECGRDLSVEEQSLAERPNGLLVRTKADLVPEPEDPAAVSVVTGAGIAGLVDRIVARLFAVEGGGDDTADLPVLTRERHRVALERARGEVEAAAALLASEAGDVVLAAHHAQHAVAALDELVGVVDPEEVLSRVFSQFCVGK